MKIIDINGCTVEITNLNEAIQITRRYKQYEHENLLKIKSQKIKKTKN